MNLPPWARFPSNQKMKISPDWKLPIVGVLFLIGILIASPGILLAMPFWILSYWLVSLDD